MPADGREPATPGQQRRQRQGGQNGATANRSWPARRSGCRHVCSIRYPMFTQTGRAAKTARNGIANTSGQQPHRHEPPRRLAEAPADLTSAASPESAHPAAQRPTATRTPRSARPRRQLFTSSGSIRSRLNCTKQRHDRPERQRGAAAARRGPASSRAGPARTSRLEAVARSSRRALPTGRARRNRAPTRSARPAEQQNHAARARSRRGCRARGIGSAVEHFPPREALGRGEERQEQEGET